MAGLARLSAKRRQQKSPVHGYGLAFASKTDMPRRFPRTLALAVTVVGLAVGGEWALVQLAGESDATCSIASLPLPLPDVPEASGIAQSARQTGLYWTFNDSGAPLLFGIDGNGQSRAKVRVTGATVRNWEDISVGRCAAGSCIYIADIGDNDSRRASIRVIRVAEPSPRDGATRSVDTFDAHYPDGPHDAEAAFVLPDGQVFVITKEKLAQVYRFPLESGHLATLQHVVGLPLKDVTDADASADGTRIAVRTKDAVVFYQTEALLAGNTDSGAAVSTSGLGEPQGEGVTFGPGNTLVLTGEGGGRKTAPRPGTLATMQCRFSPPASSPAKPATEPGA